MAGCLVALPFFLLADFCCICYSVSSFPFIFLSLPLPLPLLYPFLQQIRVNKVHKTLVLTVFMGMTGIVSVLSTNLEGDPPMYYSVTLFVFSLILITIVYFNRVSQGIALLLKVTEQIRASISYPPLPLPLPLFFLQGGVLVL